MKLIIEDDEGKTTVYPLGDREITVGRKEGNTIRLMERNVSRRHARIFELGGRLVIEDLDSYNGIQLNGERVLGRAEMSAGDRVEIGDYHLELEPGDEEEDTFDVPLAEPAPTPALYPEASEEATTPTPAGDPTASGFDPVGSEPARRELPVVSPQPRLICVSTEYAGTELYPRGDDVIGRIEDSDLVLEHPSVSRRHARVQANGGVFEIRDLQSANGVLVNGDVVEAQRLRPNDVVELGHVVLRYVPAGERFEPTEDELDAIQAAGVEVVAETDPSRAVTVTDEPVFAPRPPSDTPPFGTTVRVPRPSFPAGLSPAAGAEPGAQPAPAPDLDGRRGEGPAGRGSRRWVVGAVALVGAAGLAAMLWASIGPGRGADGEWDQVLRTHFEKGRFERVIRIYEAHEFDFVDPAAAGRIMGAAEERYVQDLLQRAHAAIERAQHDRAIELLSRCLERDPTMTACHWSIGVAYARSDRDDRAAEHYRRFVELAPGDDRVPSVLEVLESYESGRKLEVEVP